MRRRFAFALAAGLSVSSALHATEVSCDAVQAMPDHIDRYIFAQISGMRHEWRCADTAYDSMSINPVLASPQVIDDAVMAAMNADAYDKALKYAQAIVTAGHEPGYYSHLVLMTEALRRRNFVDAISHAARTGNPRIEKYAQKIAADIKILDIRAAEEVAQIMVFSMSGDYGISARTPGGDDDEFIFLHRAALAVDPDYRYAHIRISSVLSTAGYHDAAVAELEKIPDSHSLYITAQNHIADQFLAMGRDADAVRHLSRTLETKFKSETAGKLARVLEEFGDMEGAADYYDRAITLASISDYSSDCITCSAFNIPWDLYYARGLFLMRQGDMAGAEQDLNMALSFIPFRHNKTGIIADLATLWIRHGVNLDKAQDLLMKAYNGDRERDWAGRIPATLSHLRFVEKDYVGAISFAHEAKAVNQESPIEFELPIDFFERLADSYWHVGRKDEARAYWIYVQSRLTRQSAAQDKSLDRDDREIMDRVRQKLEDGISAPQALVPRI